MKSKARTLTLNSSQPAKTMPIRPRPTMLLHITRVSLSEMQKDRIQYQTNNNPDTADLAGQQFIFEQLIINQ